MLFACHIQEKYLLKNWGKTQFKDIKRDEKVFLTQRRTQNALWFNELIHYKPA